MKFFYIIYFAGIALFFLNSVSYALFSKAKWQTKLDRVLTAIVFSLLWPLTVFSEEGRKVLFRKTTNL
jgi:hypothetical protein